MGLMWDIVNDTLLNNTKDAMTPELQKFYDENGYYIDPVANIADPVVKAVRGDNYDVWGRETNIVPVPTNRIVQHDKINKNFSEDSILRQAEHNLLANIATKEVENKNTNGYAPHDKNESTIPLIDMGLFLTKKAANMHEDSIDAELMRLDEKDLTYLATTSKNEYIKNKSLELLNEAKKPIDKFGFGERRKKDIENENLAKEYAKENNIVYDKPVYKNGAYVIPKDESTISGLTNYGLGMVNSSVDDYNELLVTSSQVDELLEEINTNLIKPVIEQLETATSKMTAKVGELWNSESGREMIRIIKDRCLNTANELYSLRDSSSKYIRELAERVSEADDSVARLM